jgi:hypothetical protein
MNRFGLLAIAALTSPAAADPAQCRIVDVTLQPSTGNDDRFPPQIVAWIEDPSGGFVATALITEAVGTYGLGNRPGRFDFNSSRFWPYGRRTTTFPVWSTKQPLRWPMLVFQDDDDNDLSHSGAKSSDEHHYCRPLHNPNELDATTCPSSKAYTDKGKLSSTMIGYPPRADLTRDSSKDTSDVEMFDIMNPFDAVSQPTPAAGVTSTLGFAVPPEIPAGNFVLIVEVSKEFDFNATYNDTVYPSPVGIPWDDYGAPYRGQPSVLYKIPFQLVTGETRVASTLDYIGYGDPDGLDGNIRTPDSTISATPGSGAGRLAILSEGGNQFRIKVTTYFEDDRIAPAGAATMNTVDLSHHGVTLAFVAPGDDDRSGKVTSYEIRYSAGGPLTEDNFAGATLSTASLDIVDGGQQQTIALDNLLPETTYSVGVRPFDNCRNPGPLVVYEFTTLPRPIGEVDACFIATAAYGSLMAADVDLLRRFRDTTLKKSAFGELATEAYYTFGPAFAGLIGESELLRSTARGALAPVVSKVSGRY